ncbi:hypothetical protein DRQ53_11970 [bacterium]|nr:MAG: hypothetical protein DRQ53_11970 [bacterium]
MHIIALEPLLEVLVLKDHVRSLDLLRVRALGNTDGSFGAILRRRKSANGKNDQRGNSHAYNPE